MSMSDRGPGSAWWKSAHDMHLNKGLDDAWGDDEDEDSEPDYEAIMRDREDDE